MTKISSSFNVKSFIQRLYLFFIKRDKPNEIAFSRLIILDRIHLNNLYRNLEYFTFEVAENSFKCNFLNVLHSLHSEIVFI